MKRSLKNRTRTLKALTLRSTFALLPLAILAGTGTARALTSTFVTTAANTPNAGGDFTFENSVNWTNGVPGVAGADGTTAPTTLTNTDTAQFYNNTAAGAGPITLAFTRNLLNLTFFSSGTSYTVGTNAGPAFYLTDGGTVTQMGNLVTLAAPVVLAGSATFNANSTASRVLTVSGAVSGSGTGATLTLTSPYAGNNSISGAVTGSLAVLKTGVGFWALGSGSNTFSGGMTVNAGSVLDNTANANSNRVFGSSTVTLAGGTVVLGSGSNTAQTFNNALTVASNNAGTVAYRLSGTFSPTTLTGSGTLNLGLTTTANAITASTVAVALSTTTFGAFGGTINLNGVSSTITNTVTVAAAALTNTTGTVNVNANSILTSAVANVTSGSAVTVAGGTLTPNGTSVGMLTLTGNKSFSMTSGTLGLTLTSTSSFDQIVAGGAGSTSNFSLTGGTLDLGGVTAAAGNSYQVFSGFATGGTVSGITYTDFATGDGSMPTLDSTGLLTFTAVPEPGTFVQMGCLALAGLAFTVKRRRSASR